MDDAAEIGAKAAGKVDDVAEVGAKAAGKIDDVAGSSTKLGNSFAEMMSPEDAAKYQKFLEKGSTSGLKPEELQGITKVDAYQALNKVDYNEVLKLRKAGSLESGIIHNDVLDSPRTGSALTIDEINPIYEINLATGRSYIVQEFPARPQAHGFTNIVDNYVGYATKTPINNGVLYQLEGALSGVSGRFEWIIQDGQVTHRMFIQNGTMNGVPIKP